MIYLVDEEDTGNELRNALVDVAVDDLVDLLAQLLRNLGLLGLHELSHHAHHILSTLGPGIGHVQIVQRHILDDFLLLVDLSLRYGHVFLSFKIELGGVGVGPSDTLAGSSIRFDVNDVSHGDTLLLDSLVDAGVQAQLLGTLGGLQTDDEMADRASVSSQRVLRLFGGEFRHFTFVYFLRFANTETYRCIRVYWVVRVKMA